MAEFSILLNPLFKEEVIEDRSEFSLFLIPLFEEDLPCSQVHQHHDEDSKSDFETDETYDMHIEDEIPFSSSHQQEIHHTSEGEVDSSMHNEEDVLNSSENFYSVTSNEIPNEILLFESI